MSISGPSAGSRSTLRSVGLALLNLGIGAILLLVGIMQIGPALRAAQGMGKHGYFVATTQTCHQNKHGLSCTWSGVFERADGRVTLSDVGFQGSHPAFRTGSRVPAVDTGDPFNVYQLNGSHPWLGPAGYLLSGLLILVGGVMMLVGAWRRRRLASSGART